MIYLDNAATTRAYEECNKVLAEYNTKYYFNPSSVYTEGVQVKKDLNSAREHFATTLGCSKEEVYFTSSATESSNIFIKGILTGRKDQEFIFSAGEHSSVNEIAKFIKNKGHITHLINLTKEGTVDLKHLKSLVNENTTLVSIMHVSNETGAVNDLVEVAKIVKGVNNKTLLHVDGVQAYGKFKTNVKALKIDSYAICAHKIHGVKGVGAMYVKSGINVKPDTLGGGQEKGLRSGTENVAGIMSFKLASELMINELELNFEKVKEFKTYFLNEIKNNLQDVVINAETSSSPYIASLSINRIRGEILVHLLQLKGVLISTGSSCSSNSKRSGNRVLEAMGLNKNLIEGSIRVSFSSFNTITEVKEATKIIINAVNELKERMR